MRRAYLLIIIGLFFFAPASFAEKSCEINEWPEDTRFYQVTVGSKTVYWLKNSESNGDPKYINMDLGTKNEAAMRDSIFRPQTILLNTEAVNICKQKNLELPSREDFESLQSCFETTKNELGQPYLTPRGKIEIQNKFSDILGHKFWLSSTVPDVYDYSFVVKDGNLDIAARGRHSYASIRCVRH